MSGMTGKWDLKTWDWDQRSVGDIVFQTRRSLKWMQQALGASGLTMKDIVKTTTFVRSMDDMNAIGEVKREFFPYGDVTSTTVAVSGFVGMGHRDRGYSCISGWQVSTGHNAIERKIRRGFYSRLA